MSNASAVSEIAHDILNQGFHIKVREIYPILKDMQSGAAWVHTGNYLKAMDPEDWLVVSEYTDELEANMNKLELPGFKATKTKSENDPLVLFGTKIGSRVIIAKLDDLEAKTVKTLEI